MASGSALYGLLKRRAWKAGNYSLDGLRACYRHEEAFRVEVISAACLLLVSPLIAGSMAEWAIMMASVILVLIVELLNSAVEATVDRISEEYHDLAKRAKDIGSAAVFLSIILFLVIWSSVIVSRVFF